MYPVSSNAIRFANIIIAIVAVHIFSHFTVMSKSFSPKVYLVPHLLHPIDVPGPKITAMPFPETSIWPHLLHLITSINSPSLLSRLALQASGIASYQYCARRISWRNQLRQLERYESRRNHNPLSFFLRFA